MGLYDQYLAGQSYLPPGTQPGFNPGFGMVQPPLTFNPGFGVQPGVPQPVPGSAPPLTGAPVIHAGYRPYYNAPGADLSQTEFGRRAANLIPEGVYQRFLAKRGMADQNSRLGQWAGNQYGHVQDLFKMAQLQRPDLTFDRFLKTGGAGKMMREFLALSPSQRGAGVPTRTSSIMWG